MAKQESNVSRVYEALRQMAANFAFMPDQRINESELSKQLGASRTPLREALNQLVAEGFLTFQNNRGFFCRSLTPKYIQDLYEVRVAVECEALRLSCDRAEDSEIAALSLYLEQTEADYETAEDPAKQLEMDETFHMRLVRLSGNDELERSLRSLNDRIRYIRLIDLKRMRDKTKARVPGELSAHSRILMGLAGRDAKGAEAAMRGHIEKRKEAATEAVQIAFSQLYVPQD
ncbi:GntR family transcriptional regulator [Parasedimentitalea marina]|uniref:GntR family transcriptional regulator n=1 Tax=Parasedimentitalea marina TaxID=2483033 RepID=A0A3T0MZW8_9RHOB|nr:GntR family transcriptional regulator [Parasedimentitalea marina]AZV77289.1 GntR family transcriptional regulator [Parasedimentitalea marina]